MPNSERPTKKLDIGSGYSITLRTYITQREFLELVAATKEDAAKEIAAAAAVELVRPGENILTTVPEINEALLDLPRAQYAAVDRAFVNLLQGNEIDYVADAKAKGENPT